MSYSSETRFTPVYSNSNSEGIPNSFQERAQTNNNTLNSGTIQSSAIPGFNTTFTHSITQGPDQQISSIDLLLGAYRPEQRIKVKTDNQQKYNMRQQSPVYKFPSKYLQLIVYKYPGQFPAQMQEQMKTNLSKIRKNYDVLHRVMFGTILYWAVLRRKAWFILTGNPIMRFSCIFIAFNNMIDLGFEEDDYISKTVFINNASFENVITKYQIDPLAPRAQYIS